MVREQFRGPKWSYFVNFRCSGRSGPLSGPGPWGFSLTSLMDDPALIVRLCNVVLRSSFVRPSVRLSVKRVNRKKGTKLLFKFLCRTKDRCSLSSFPTRRMFGRGLPPSTWKFRPNWPTQSNCFSSKMNFSRRKFATTFLCVKNFSGKVVRHSQASSV